MKNRSPGQRHQAMPARDTLYVVGENGVFFSRRPD
jgi:hypothetical protein